MNKNGTIIVWFRADLRIHDHPALAGAIADARQVIPVFILDEKQLTGKFSSSNRNRFLIECLKDLRASLQDKGGDLIIRRGLAAEELTKLAQQTKASSVYVIGDYTPFGRARDEKVATALRAAKAELKTFEGKLMFGSVEALTTKTNTPYKVFTPFYKSWLVAQRSELAPTPTSISVPKINAGEIPTVEFCAKQGMLSPDVIAGGETAARQRLHDFLDEAIHEYHNQNNNLGTDGTSRLSAYLHFGCISVREVESLLPEGEGAQAWHRQLAWRDFYHYVLFHFPNPEREFQERYRGMQWSTSKAMLSAWKDGKTGYPVVDAAMRQLKTEGWMHNRARLIVGSFLTKDLGIDWREGEAHFMHWLLDGDMANNNGNWQWIGSVGVDPAPVFRRLYNPTSQRDRFDPTGSYVRSYVPELKQVPDEHLSEPWLMSEHDQKKYGCVINKDYPAPVVDHKEARLRALEWYRSV